MTLPLIYALSQSSWLEKRRIINIIKNESNKPSKVAEVIAYVRASGGIDYATAAMKKLVNEALTILHQFPTSPFRTSLEGLVAYTIERNK